MNAIMTWLGENWPTLVVLLCAVERILAVRSKARQTLAVVVDAIESAGRAIAPGSPGANSVNVIKSKIRAELGEQDVELEAAIEKAQPTEVEKIEHRPSKAAVVLNTLGAVVPLLSRLKK